MITEVTQLCQCNHKPTENKHRFKTGYANIEHGKIIYWLELPK